MPGAGPDPLIRAHRVGYVRRGQVILDDVDLVVAPGERVALVGPSGSGKTTLLTLLAGLGTPDTGQVTVKPQLPGDSRTGTALVLQGYGLLVLLTAAENIEVALRAAGHAPSTAMDRAARLLAELDLEAQADNLVGELSGGQQQRVAVARALALDPALLLADEPTAEQDPAHRELVVERLLHRDHPGAGLVLATHDPAIAARCDRVVEIHAGRVAEQEEPPNPTEVGHATNQA
jgi:putative ABC transport system ATP-binding protein